MESHSHTDKICERSALSLRWDRDSAPWIIKAAGADVNLWTPGSDNRRISRWGGQLRPWCGEVATVATSVTRSPAQGTVLKVRRWWMEVATAVAHSRGWPENQCPWHEIWSSWRKMSVLIRSNVSWLCELSHQNLQIIRISGIEANKNICSEIILAYKNRKWK